MRGTSDDLLAVLFDLDGTLLDSFQSHLAIYKATLARFGISLNAVDFRRLYTPDWNSFYERVGLPRADWDAASAVWLEQSATHRPRPLPGARATLARLGRRFRLGLVTAGSRSRVSADLERGGINRYFDVVITADDVRARKPDPEGLHAALRALGLVPPQALYVGDTEPDFEFARAANVAFVGIASEFSRADQPPEYVRLPRIGELPRYLGAG